jgi:HPt (histidine-containing phosphotransfer) domain-containing protein
MRERESDLHFLKGSALNLGFDALGGLCAASGQRAAQGTLDELEVVSVIEAYRASRAAFEAGRPAAA